MIYLDNHSTTRLDPAVFEAMQPYFFEKYGNASHGVHRFNWEAESAIELARSQVATLLHAHEKEIYFTSGATESNHLALLGLLPFLKKTSRPRVLSIQIEHSSVLGPLERMQAQGIEVEWIKTEKDGRVDLEDLERKLSDRVGLVSIAYANHEIGTIQDISEISKKTRKIGAFLHTDAVQAVGKVDIDVERDGIDLLTLSAHKIHGPKGSGAIFIRRKNPHIELEPVFKGGNQEHGIRPGTPNTPGIVGLGKAAEQARLNRVGDVEKLSKMRDFLWKELSSELSGLIRNGSVEHALPHNLNVSIEGVDGAALFGQLKTIAVSNASACIGGIQDYSQVLSVLGVNPELARATLRFGLSKFNHLDELKTAAQDVVKVVKWLREMERKFAVQTGE